MHFILKDEIMFKKILITIIILLILGGGYWAYSALLRSNTAFNEKEVVLYISTGSDFSDVMHKLTPLLKDRIGFELIAKQRGYTTNVKAGKYIIKRGDSNITIIRTLRNGNSPVKVRFNNQERIEDLAGRIAEQIEPDSIALLQSFLEPTFLKDNGFTPETAIAMYIPNTYEFYWNTSATEFRDRILKEYQRFWTEERKTKAATLGLTPVQVSTLASIIQKETSKKEELPRIAGVYINRLREGMNLGADPTAIFAMKQYTGNYNLVIKRVNGTHTSVDNPYNTYKYAGLPPGPITMPDITAIDAVLNAEQHDYLYFAADPERFGYHNFARTFEQHRIFAKKYWNWANEKGVK
ncbi:UPF0755 protein [Capnocytophaga haemolytica]|mgnify:CR=1 FL=1|uniref:Endolytic murein transglycosylase n=2 Tax=Capnocytophaga haemolytica TaxID=45243 RepID=A0AAX2GWW0_9FLAO|nr:UPF0755 protein [Capnocytophaga haemolytica]SNV04241.1 putative aminodeoxychorismate lyase [Capnocytophaga haemolytica]